jgi:hypothetical protein
LAQANGHISGQSIGQTGNCNIWIIFLPFHQAEVILPMGMVIEFVKNVYKFKAKNYIFITISAVFVSHWGIK